MRFLESVNLAQRRINSQQLGELLQRRIETARIIHLRDKTHIRQIWLRAAIQARFGSRSFERGKAFDDPVAIPCVDRALLPPPSRLSDISGCADY